ncbi:uncharacterized protein IL334_003185 [Kwoniella shivajii]|uniref:Protein transport protein sec16 n=1 Tax=Kwoniella shivajii TaxID=564305 RepID=A0ABZ1CWU7_9TREE|nr:hypothetical protein IL334_003185 [Kwoniella shivajii]
MASLKTAAANQPTASPQAKATTIDKRFGGNEADIDDSDIFAQLGSVGEDPFDEISQDNSQSPLPHPTEEEEQFFAEVTQSAQPVPSQQDEHPSPPPADELLAPPTQDTRDRTAPETITTPAAVDDQDFSDLLAEFEAEHDLAQEAPLGIEEGIAAVSEEDRGENGIEQHAGVVQDFSADFADSGTLQVPIPASALFNDDSSDPFADLIPQESAREESLAAIHQDISETKPASPSPVPSLSIEHSQVDIRRTGLGIDAGGDSSFQSMFSDASNFLGDTTFDDSIQILPDEDGQANGEPLRQDGDGHEALDFEIPQGWYDEDGNWNWYTEEEKEQVRSTMMGQTRWAAEADDITQEQGLGQNQTPSHPYSPALHAGVSENAARRTPQPETPSTFADNTYDPYAPSTAQYSTTTAASTSYGEPSSSSPYAPYSGVSTTAPYTSNSNYDSYSSLAPMQSASTPYASAPSNPYAPASTATTNPYAPVASFTGLASREVPAVVSKPIPPKPQPQRTASNAYDPPFLKPQKSFIRAASAIPSAGSPAFSMQPAMTMSPPQASSTPPPPTGPPRRSKPEGRPPSRGPTFAAPPKGPERAQTSANVHYDQISAYNAPPRPTSASQNRRSVDVLESFAPPKPLHRPPPSSYDPPLPTPVFRAPSRPASVSNHQGHAPSSQPASHPPKFAPPPKTSQSPFAAPPRPLSRGAPPRQASPMFADRPPSRPDVDQRLRSPPGSIPPGAAKQLLSPPKVNTNLFEHQSRNPPDGLISLDGYNERSDQYGGYQPGPDVSPQPSYHSEIPHISPPILSRRYDEDGEDGDEVDDPYSGSKDPAVSRSYQNGETSSFQPPNSAPYDDQFVQDAAHDPYAPSSLGLNTRESPQKKLPPSSSPYAPYAPHAPTHSGFVDLNEDSYALNSTQNDGYPTNSYAPPSGISPTKSQGYFHKPQASQASQASTSSYEPSPWSPVSTTKPIGTSQPNNPYAPGPARTASPAYSAGYGVSPPSNNYSQSMHASVDADETYIPQQVLEQKPVSEDPLGRYTLAARNAPIAVFGFGGTLITAFPGAAESGDFHKGHSRVPSYGYASGRGQLWIRNISEVAAPAALKSDLASFPGPLVFDPSTPKGAAGDKKKREAVISYLDTRAEEIEKGLPYLKSSANKARREEEGRLVLIKALKALTIGEGKLAGSPEIEEALRLALANPSLPTISTAHVGTVSSSSFSSSLYPPVSSSSAGAPVAASTAQLIQISSLLAQGNKRDAALYAADQDLWSHALVISSNVDVDLWRDVVTRFTISEVGDRPKGTAGIKASYLLSGGVTPTIVDELVQAATITDDPSNDQWREVISTVLFNAKPTELTCLDELGSKFLSMGLINAAHACFLLSPLSPFFDVTPASYDRPITLAHNSRDEEAIVFAEIAEYARSLISTPKGQESHFAGLPQLLPYKLVRAWRLAELGEMEMAQKYCAAIEGGSKMGKNLPSLLPPAYAASLEDLLERLTGTPSVNPANALGAGRKSAKPGFDKLGSWIEGRLTKFIAGEEGGDAPPKPPTTGAKAAGPFAQFSTISPNASGTLSRATSTADFAGTAGHGNGYLGVGSVSRTTSPALQMTPQWGQQTAFGQSHTSSSASSSYGDPYPPQNDSGGYNAWGTNEETNEGEDTPHVYGQNQPSDEGEYINPMAQLNIGPSAPSSSSYEPPRNNSKPAFEEDDEDDLGFGNKGLSRERTPRPPTTEVDEKAPAAKESKSEPKKDDPSSAKSEQKSSSWLGKLWGGKKPAADQQHTTGPVKANLGEESSMVFDPEMKRWIVKGAKPEPAATAAPPPPPSRAQTVSPSRSSRPEPPSGASRAMSATPPPSQRGPPPPPNLPRSNTGFAEGPDGSIKRMKSSLSESVTASDIPSGAPQGPPKPPGSRPPSGPPSRTPSAAGPSLDDLLSRPPTKRPASAAAKKGARNRYVDVFQQPGE